MSKSRFHVSPTTGEICTGVFCVTHNDAKTGKRVIAKCNKCNKQIADDQLKDFFVKE